ncbi:protein kinase domain-containing protein [Spiractinospora alimapuensis]|uniref:protein kinase domain-containing protein n=1 Tax=Spiractinospora alimapuensis TaxID=2820884 RepID=UPI001F19DB12|nr:protein kinase [Spiractinospora alimapuensis]
MPPRFGVDEEPAPADREENRETDQGEAGPTERLGPPSPSSTVGGSSGPAAPTRHVTQVIGADQGHTRVFADSEPASPTPATAPSPNATTTLAPQVEEPERAEPAKRRGRRFAPLEWFSRGVARVLVGPASDLEHSIPAELREKYHVQGHVGAGGEAIVYRAEPEKVGVAGTPVALKVYRPGHDLNRELLDRLRARPGTDPYTPVIDGYGYARSSWGEDLAWEAQEFFDQGSLRGVLDEAPLSEDHARDIVAALAACLRHWQEELQHNHTDVKPENLLRRRGDSPVFALTDFGGAVRATMSRVYGGLAVTEAYAAPEVIEGRREAPAAWWSLGIMVHEMMTGRRPEGAGNWLSARSSEVDVSAITDPRWRLLARGLLTPVPTARWGYREVMEWLAGEEPTVARPRRYRSLRFGDVDHDDPPSLAFDLMDRSDKGAVWLGSHWQSLRTWLDREVNDYTFDRANLTQLASHPERTHLVISSLAAAFVPGMPPRYRGYEVTAEGVLALATGDGSRHAALREAIELGALAFAARHWCGHTECRDTQGRCARLERVQHEVPLVMTETMQQVERLVRDGDAQVTEPADHEWDAAWAQAVELVLDEDAARRYRRSLRAESWHPTRRSHAHRAEWWREQRRAGARTRSLSDAAAVQANAALVTAVLLLPSATRAGAIERERQNADWQRRRQALGARITRAVTQRGNTPEALGSGDDSAPSDNASASQRKEHRRQERQQRRVDRGMRQIERAMTAGRCRRFTRPLAMLGFLDALGTALLFSVGLAYTAPWIANADQIVTTIVEAPGIAHLSGALTALLGVLPGEIGLSWWFAALLALALILCGRYAANHRKRARNRLIAYRLAIAGSVLMALRLAASALLMVVYAVLIPLSMVAG